MKRQNKIAILIFCLMVFIVGGNAIYRRWALQKDGVILYGKILGDEFSAKSTVLQFKYQFIYKRDTIINYSPAGVKYSDKFINRNFPVRYSPRSGFSEILITPRHYKRYGLDYPDSLEWVKKYLIETF